MNRDADICCRNVGIICIIVLLFDCYQRFFAGGMLRFFNVRREIITWYVGSEFKQGFREVAKPGRSISMGYRDSACDEIAVTPTYLVKRVHRISMALEYDLLETDHEGCCRT